MPLRPTALLALALTAAGVAGMGELSRGEGRPAADLAVKITSPLGRTGLVDRIRIVAQVQHRDGVQLGPVKFFVDSTLLGEDGDGAPYAIEWTDTNPFEPREISVEVS